MFTVHVGYYTGSNLCMHPRAQLTSTGELPCNEHEHSAMRLLLLVSFFGLSFAAAGHDHDHDHDHDDDHDCSSTTFATAEEFGECLDIVVDDFEDEREEGFTFIPSDFNVTIQSLFYLNFSSTPVDVTVCNCDFSFDAQAVYASPDPHLNIAVSAVYVRSQPTATFLHGAGVTMPGKYALVMVDASDGAPSATPGLHWLVYNFDGSNMAGGSVGQAYRSPAPSKSSSPHLYLFLLYKQTSEISNLDVTQYTTGCDHCMFDVNAFAQQNNLTLIGGTWQRVSYDNYIASSTTDLNCDTGLEGRKGPCSDAQTAIGAWQLIAVLMAACLLFY